VHNVLLIAVDKTMELAHAMDGTRTIVLVKQATLEVIAPFLYEQLLQVSLKMDS
jgi:hypothetical protein